MCICRQGPVEIVSLAHPEIMSIEKNELDGQMFFMGAENIFVHYTMNPSK